VLVQRDRLLIGLKGGDSRSKRRCVDHAHRTTRDHLPIPDYSLDDLMNECLDDELFAIEQSDDCVCRVLDRLDEIGVHNQL